jgi:glycosyltransferase involved in cell wall biosynthesis
VSRIAYLLGTFPALTETFVLGEIEALRRAGVHVELFALARPGTPHDSSHGADLAAQTTYGPPLASRETWRANRAAFVRDPGRYLRALAAVAARTALNPIHCLKSLAVFPSAVVFSERMRERGVRHVHAHWATYPATAAYVVSRLTGLPYSITAHVYDATLIRSLMREKLRRAAFVVTCNRFTADRLARLVPEATGRVFVNYHGTSLDTFERTGDEPADRTIPEILAVGSLFPRKGYLVLLEACRLLRDRGRRFHCTVVGEGPLRQRMQAFIRTHRLGDVVQMAGPQTHAEVLRRYRTADLFALACMTDYLGWQEITTDPVLLLEVGFAIPFRPLTDGIPNVIAEAMAMELPVVSTTVAGVPELVEDGRSGLLVPEQQPGALADALERLLADPDLRRAMGRRGRERVLEVFDRAKNIRDLVDIFERHTDLEPPGRSTRAPHLRVVPSPRSRRRRRSRLHLAND